MPSDAAGPNPIRQIIGNMFPEVGCPCGWSSQFFMAKPSMQLILSALVTEHYLQEIAFFDAMKMVGITLEDLKSLVPPPNNMDQKSFDRLWYQLLLEPVYLRSDLDEAAKAHSAENLKEMIQVLYVSVLLKTVKPLQIVKVFLTMIKDGRLPQRLSDIEFSSNSQLFKIQETLGIQDCKELYEQVLNFEAQELPVLNEEEQYDAIERRRIAMAREVGKALKNSRSLLKKYLMDKSIAVEGRYGMMITILNVAIGQSAFIAEHLESDEQKRFNNLMRRLIREVIKIFEEVPVFVEGLKQANKYFPV